MTASIQQSCAIFRTILISLLPYYVLSLVSTPMVAPNPLYSDAGVFVFNTAPYFNSSTTLFRPHTFTITLTRACTPLHHLGYAIHELDYSYTNRILNFSVYIPPPTLWGPAFLTARIYTNEANKFSVLKISYILI